MGKTYFPEGAHIDGELTADFIKTKDGNLQAVNSTTLQRVDTSVYETVLEGVEYFSPDQQGGSYGKIIRQYYAGVSATSTLNAVTISGLAHQITSGGYVTSGTPEEYPFPWGDPYANDLARVVNDTFTIGTSWTGPYSVWVDYTKTTAPTTGISSQIQPTLDPTVLQRVDNLQWEHVDIGRVGTITHTQDNGGAVEVVCSMPHTLTTGQQVQTTGIAVAGIAVITVTGSTTFVLNGTSSGGPTGGGTYESISSSLYFSAEQNGNYLGSIVRQYWHKPSNVNWGANEVQHDLRTGVSKVLESGGYVLNAGTNGNEIGSYFSGVYFTHILVDDAPGAGTLRYHYANYGDAGDIVWLWADFVLQTPPTTKPTGQPFADPSSPLLKRADTGVWELPTVGVEYKARDQSQGMGAEVYCKHFSGTVSASTPTTLSSTTQFGAILGSSGYVMNVTDAIPLGSGVAKFAYSRTSGADIAFDCTSYSGQTYNIWVYYTK